MVQLLNVYCLFCLTGNLRLFLIYNFELINVGGVDGLWQNNVDRLQN